MRSIGQKLGKIILCGIFALVFAATSGCSVSALDIEQKDLSVSAHSSTLTIHNNGIGSTDFQITPQLEFNKLGDFITYKLTLHNNDGKRYKITEVKDDNTNDAIELTYIYPTDLDTTDKSLELTIKYVKKSSTPLQTVTATISLVDEDDQSQQITIVVPNTGTFTSTDTRSATIRNTVIIYGAFAGTIVTIYIIIRRKQKANKRSTKLPKILVTTTLLLGLIPVAVIAATAKDLQFIIEFNSITLNGPYTMTFNSNGGTPVPTQTVDHNTYATKPQDPQKPGYTFAKWLDQTNTEFNFTTTKVTQDYNLTATYTLDTYQLNLDLAGGTAGTPANPITYNYEDNDIILTNPTRDGHDFLGWTGEGITTPTPTITIPKHSTGDKFYTANWKIKTYTVTFNTDGGTPTPQQQTINYDSLATKPQQDPQKPGYTFSKWLDEANQEFDFTTTKITTNRNLKADYTLDTYTINYDLAGGTEPTPANPTRYTYEDNDITLTNPTRDHYDFAGWITPTDNTPHLTVTIPKNSTGNKSYIATWTEKSYTVTFDANGGTPTPQTQTIKYQQYATEPTTNSSKNGYNFKSWQLNNTDYNFTTTEITGDITLTANYEAIKYTINYNLNGGTEGTPANPTEYTIETSDFTLTNPTKPNVAFAGWTTPTDNTLRKTVTITQGSTGDKTFIANYKPAYTVTYDTNGGDPINPSSFLVGENDQIGTLIDATKDHYDFTGWYIGTTPIDETYEVTGDIIITAHYTPHKYKITYNLNGGTETTNPTEYTIETPDFPLAEPTPPSTDKRFKGWTTPTNNTPTKSVIISQGTTGDLTFTAVYDDRHLVTFDPDSNYGAIPDADKTRYVWDGEQIGTLPANPTVTHPLKQFDCWGVNNTCINDNYTVTDDTTVVAIYKDKTTVNVIDDQKGTEVHDPNLCTKNSYVTNLDPAGNLRYVGACPKNYVWFNCDVSKYTGDLAELQQMDEDEYNAATCERWRIIGTFNVSNGTKTEKRVKLIRDESIGTFRQRNADHRIVQWDWTNSYDVLVNHYTKTPASGSTDEQITAFYNQTYNTGGGTHYYKNNLRQGGLDLIEQTVFYTGYPASRVNAATNFANIYNNERNKDINYSLAFINNSGYDDGRASGNIRWTGLVGLANLSDWAYSSSGGNGASDRGCLDVYNGTSWSNNNCNANSWIPQTLTMNPTSENIESNARDTNAIIKYNSNMTPYAPNDSHRSNYYAAMRPVVFLKSNVRTGSGTGSYSDPFTLSVDE